MKHSLRYAATLGILSSALPILTLAQGVNIDNVNVPSTAGSVITAIEKLTNWIFSIFLVIAVLMIVIAAFNFLTANGNSEKLGSAKKQLVYAVVSVAIAVLAKSIVTVTCALVNATCTL